MINKNKNCEQYKKKDLLTFEKKFIIKIVFLFYLQKLERLQTNKEKQSKKPLESGLLLYAIFVKHNIYI